MTKNSNHSNQPVPIILMALITSSLFLSACGTLAPIRERDLAFASLTLATEIDAKQFAETDVVAAEDYFSTGEDLIVRDKKSVQNKQAKRNYLDAKDASDEALRITLMMLIEETDLIIEAKRPVALEHSLENILQAAETEQATAKSTLAEAHYPESLAATREARNLLDQILGEDDKYYVVILDIARRDCLWRISDKFLNDPWRWEEIYEINKEAIADPDLIHPGQRLLIPKE